MGAVICSRQVVQADPGQPGQASRRASHLHQASDALAEGHFGGPQQHPVPSQHPQPGPGCTEAGIEQNAVADDNMVRHSTSPQTWHRPGSGHRSYPSTPKVTSTMAEIPGGGLRSRERQVRILLGAPTTVTENKSPSWLDVLTWP